MRSSASGAGKRSISAVLTLVGLKCPFRLAVIRAIIPVFRTVPATRLSKMAHARVAEAQAARLNQEEGAVEREQRDGDAGDPECDVGLAAPPAGRDGRRQSVPLGFRPKRQFPVSLAGGCEQGVGNGRADWRDTRLAHA